MGYFLRLLMRSRCLPESIIDRNMGDNWRLDDRARKLFKKLTGNAFGDVLRDLTDENKRRGGNLDYHAVWQFVKEVIKIRNNVIHNGAIYAFSEGLAEKCINNIHGVNNLFISMHNQYVAKSTACGGAD